MTTLSNVSREQRIAWGRKGGLIGAARQTPSQRRLSAKKAAAAKYSKYSHEELSSKYAGFLTRRLAGMTPEQATESQRKAGQRRWEGVSAEERSAAGRKAIRTRLARIAYSNDPNEADRLLAFLQDSISTNHYAPTLAEICKALHHDADTTRKLLRMLEAIGQLKQNPWTRGISLVGKVREPAEQPREAISEALIEPEAQIAHAPVPRSTRKCYDCDEAAVSGKTRCAAHFARANQASKRSYERRRAI